MNGDIDSGANSGLEQAAKAVGSKSALARLLGLRRQTVHQWRQVPAERLDDVERVTGVPREVLRPDIFRQRQ